MGLFVWCFGVDRRYDQLGHHTILFGPRYRALLKDIFVHKRLAEDFSLYLHRPTATDPALGPPGCDTFYVLSPVPNLQGGQDWRVEAEPYRQRIAAWLEAELMPDLSRHLVASKLMTPLYFRDQLNATHGEGFGLAPLLTQSAWFRPHTPQRRREKRVPGGRRRTSRRGIAGRALFRSRARQGDPECRRFRLNACLQARAIIAPAARRYGPARAVSTQPPGCSRRECGVRLTASMRSAVFPTTRSISTPTVP